MKNLATILMSVVVAIACSPASKVHYLGSTSDQGNGSLGNDDSGADTGGADDGSGNNDDGAVIGDGGDIGDIEAPEPTNLVFAGRVYSLAHGKALSWDGCNKKARVQGGYNSHTKCGRGLFHPKFAAHLDKYFFRCVKDAAARAGYPEPQKVFVKHFGSYNNRNARGSSTLSMHAYARALDISDFNLYDKNGKRTLAATHVRKFKGKNKIFYNEFRDCWKESISNSCGRGDREYKGSIGIPGSKLGGNSLHNDHIHLSFGQCAGR